MKKVVFLLVTGLLFFGVSASVSWWLQRDKRTATSPPASHDPNDDDAWTKVMNNRPSTGPAIVETRPDPPRVAVRPPFNQGADEVVQLANTYRDRLASLRERETQLGARQKQMELVYQDIRGERAAIDELRKQVTEELNGAKEMQAELEKKKLDADDQRQKTAGQVKELEQRMINFDGMETSNVQKMAEMLNNMAPESAARILQQMADTGKMETAVKLMGLMKERQAAKVLSEFTDPSMAAQLLDKLKDLKRPSADAGK
jgi:flagellar motility protein MotE (MotC chaperone)